ncbi:hypothetical protein [Leptolyngbya sp. FACHB-261]|uniref:hypothetical protein n=1 Tax=Leptolyngbya sp. FACHB-261 TaxID=2692806 RepID=UPI001688A291|nr:hypothetical protein [Leptolyngbya sp. FACHB-261]MBD2104606.1 hypothetical protein [Leptolyngbya sp. FACHB-261]
MWLSLQRKSIEKFLKHHRLLIAGVVVVALLSRLMFVGLLHHPRHGDRAFYYTVAENLVDGRGFEVDYIWNYLSNPERLPHSSNDFWMPMTAVIISLSMFVFGKSLPAALLPSSRDTP